MNDDSFIFFVSNIVVDFSFNRRPSHFLISKGGNHEKNKTKVYANY